MIVHQPNRNVCVMVNRMQICNWNCHCNAFDNRQFVANFLSPHLSRFCASFRSPKCRKKIMQSMARHQFEKTTENVTRSNDRSINFINVHKKSNKHTKTCAMQSLHHDKETKLAKCNVVLWFIVNPLHFICTHIHHLRLRWHFTTNLHLYRHIL